MNGKISFANFEVDTTHRLLRRDGETVALSAKAFDVLEFLAQNPGRVVAKNEILDAVWENQFVEEANLKVQISAIRKALGEGKNEHRFLVTLPGKGYKFVGDIRNGTDEIVLEKHQISRVIIEQETEVTDTTSVPDQRPLTVGKRSRSRVFASGATVLGILLLVLGSYWIWNRSSANIDEVVAAEADPRIKRLTNRGRVNRAVISPNGEFFAYTEVERGTLRTELRIGQTDGGGDRSLRPVEGVFHHPIAFSADGSWLYYTTTDPVAEHKQPRGDLYKAPIVGGVPQKIGERISLYAAISPDEKLIAFPQGNESDKTSALMVAALDGTGEREIVRRPANQAIDSDSISWSQDGQLLAFSATTGTNKTDASRNSCEIFVVRMSDGSVTQLTSLEWNRVMLTRWLIDSSGLIAVGRDGTQLNTSSVWKIDHPSGKIRRISRDANRYAGYLTLSADSSLMVAVQAEAETNLWVGAPDDPANATQITFSTSGRQDGWHGMDWTPEGDLVYTAWIDESMTIWSADADGSNPKQLTSIGFRDTKPIVTPDGRFIVFESNRSGTNEIWRINIDGGDLEQLTGTKENSDPSVTADSQWVVYRHSEGDGSSLWRVPIGGGEAVLVTDHDAIIPRVSPDGNLVAFGTMQNGKSRLMVVSIDGTREPISFEVPTTCNFRYSLHWTPGGKFVTYPDEANGIWQQSLEGGSPIRLRGIPAERVFSYEWSRDGKQFAYGRQREVRDAVLISDFR